MTETKRARYGSNQIDRMAAQGFVPLEEAARLLGISRGSLYKRCADGKIAFVPIAAGKREHRYFLRSELVRHVGRAAAVALGLISKRRPPKTEQSAQE